MNFQEFKYCSCSNTVFYSLNGSRKWREYYLSYFLVNKELCCYGHSTEELADALLADEIRKSSVTSIQTQAQVHHSPVLASSSGTQASSGTEMVTSTPRSVSGDSGIGEGSVEGSAVSVETIQHQLAITTQELMETKEALDKSEKMISEMKEIGGRCTLDIGCY